MRDALVWDVAEEQLAGVGDATLGEWRERGDIALHLRRRLTADEMKYGRIESVCDVRGTEEFVKRIDRMRPLLPARMRYLPIEAYP